MANAPILKHKNTLKHNRRKDKDMTLNKIPDRCLFCRTKKYPPNESKAWRSNILVDLVQVWPIPRSTIVDTYVTVCPKCRGKHTIEELYNAVTEISAKRNLKLIRKALKNLGDT